VPEPTLEREAELARIHAALEAAAGGEGRLVVVEGPPGIGKTRLLEAAQARAKQQGFGRLRAVGDEPERALVWGVVRQMAERSLLRYHGEVRRRILAGPAGTALRVLDEVPEPGADDVVLARTLHQLWWVAADLSADRPLLITVDDAQWADLPSLRFLAYLSRRLSDLSVALIVGTRPVETAGPLAEIATTRAGEHLLPAPLSVDAIRALAGEDVVAPVAAALHTASGGNPFFAEQLVTELRRGGHDPADPASAGAVGTLAPHTVARVVLARLGPDERALAAATAVLGARTDPAAAAQVAELEPDRALAAADGLRREHVLTDDPAELQFTHPVVREAVIAGVPAGARAQLHAAAAMALLHQGASGELVATHLLEAPPRAVPGAAVLLRAAGRQALGLGDAASAAALLRRARSESDGDAALQWDLGRALLAVGEPQEARPLLLAAAEAATRPHDRAERLALAAEATARIGGPEAGTEELRARIQSWPGRLQDRLPLDARLGTMNWFALGHTKGSSEHLAGFADLPGQTAEERVLLALLAQRLLNAPRPAAEVGEIALRAVGDGALARDQGVDLLPWGICMHVLVCIDAVAECEAELTVARARLAVGGIPSDFACVAMSSAFAGWLTGDLRRAEADAIAALEAQALVDPVPLRYALRGVAARLAALSQIEQGKLDEAAATLAAFDAQPPESDAPSVPVIRLRVARAAHALAVGDPGTALAQARRMQSEEQAIGGNSVAVSWRGPAALALARLGRQDEAREVADEQLAAARAFGAASELGAALRVVARLDGARRLDHLDEAVAVLEASPARLQLAGALADLGEALGVAGRRTDAREPLTRALELAEACAARPLAQRAADGLGALGDRPRRMADAGVDELTASERRVAQLAATGRTNREIAQELFVTPKTVENHLRHAYAKLGVGGRRELAGVLA
jgi:DNA-binding CsgD family transcriptional regulator